MSDVRLDQLLEAGVHFGHQTRRWNPKMKPFIFTERNGIHIIDLQQTVGRLGDAMNYVRDLAASGGSIMFIGTKKQAQETIEQESARCNMPYVNQRWMGGMMTNFTTIQTRIRRLQELEARQEQGEFERLTKKEANLLIEEMERLQRLLGGMRSLTRVPNAVFIVDPHREALAVAEARRLSLPIVAMVDTNCNPDVIDFPIPSNDDAIRAIRLLSSRIADAVLEGMQQRESELARAESEAEAEAEFSEDGAEDEEKPATRVTLEEMAAERPRAADMPIDEDLGAEPLDREPDVVPGKTAAPLAEAPVGASEGAAEAAGTATEAPESVELEAPAPSAAGSATVPSAVEAALEREQASDDHAVESAEEEK
jgi:small subunit ribosomal protein S2